MLCQPAAPKGIPAVGEDTHRLCTLVLLGPLGARKAELQKLDDDALERGREPDEPRERGGVVILWPRGKSLEAAHDAAPGTVLAAGRDGIDVACGEGVLRLLRVQRPGGKAISAADYLNARRDLPVA